MMNWMKKNTYISLLLAICVLFTGYLYLTDPGEITYQEIDIEHGDSLWSLAEQYRGKMTMNDWIEIVTVENQLNDVTIVVGEPLVIPVVGGQKESTNSIKIARSVE